MPTTQVINYQQDPGQQMIMDAGKSIADTIHKSQSLKLTGQYYKILAQHADTDQKRLEFERKSTLFDKWLPKIQDAKDPGTKQMYIEALTAPDGLYKGDANTMFHDLADGHPLVDKRYQQISGAAQQDQNAVQPGGPSLKDRLMAMQPNPGSATQGELAGSQVNNYNMEAANQGLQSKVAALTAFSNARTPWGKMTNYQSPGMKELQSQVLAQASAGNPAPNPGAPMQPPTSPMQASTEYKPGETKVIHGVTYMRDERGVWHKQGKLGA